MHYGVRAEFQERMGRRASALRGAAVLVLAGAVPAAASAQQRTSAPTSVVFEGVTVVDVEQGTLLRDQRVVIVGNRIESVGSSGMVKVPTEALVVAAQGKYLIPGLWDMHTHPRDDAPKIFYPLFIANGVTGIRDAYSPVPLDTMVMWRREILAGTRVGPPRQLLAGFPFETDREDSIYRRRGGYDVLIDSLVKAGANFIKLYPFSFPAAAAARRVGVPFGGHLQRIAAENPPSPIEASDSGMRIMDHWNHTIGIDTLCSGRQATASVETCRPLAERFQRNGTWFVPTLIGQAYAQFDPNTVSERSLPILDSLTARLAEFRAGALLQGNWLRGAASAVPSPWPDSNSPADALDSAPTMHIMQRVGLPILAGTDVEGFDRQKTLPGMSLHGELAIYVSEGLTPLTALQSATLNPAKLIHGTDSLGTVAPGKLADLVLLDENPLDDITNTTTIRAVVANGRYFDRAALDQLWTEIRRTGYGDPGKEP